MKSRILQLALLALVVTSASCSVQESGAPKVEDPPSAGNSELFSSINALQLPQSTKAKPNTRLLMAFQS